MENAVRALYITAGVLIAVMVLSLAVLLYNSLQGYVEDANQQIKYNDINSFNTKYMNYANKTVTIQDVVTVASIAYENNRSHDIDINQWNANPNALYVQILLNGVRIDTTINDNMVKLLENNQDTKYKCGSSDILLSEFTGQVYSMNFSILP